MVKAKRQGPLTPKERQILDYVAKGYTNHQIAFALDIKFSTVKASVERILRKLGVANRKQATLRYRELYPSGFLARLKAAIRTFFNPRP